ncbi:MAG: hypothetical protein IKU37_01360 [Candidatus Gastranaerophilales bacterium]|nr:hypothetical protein [Candidatus Gastranaerophilales bacterium]
MELKDVKIILNRIKVNYPSFVNDDYTRSEWYKELKDYSLEDVMKKLEQHFRSEQYGNSIPKVYFLTKYLTKEKEKKAKESIYYICPFCKKNVLPEFYEEHYSKCSSIDYLMNLSKKYFDKPLNKEKLEQADDDVFEEYYWTFSYKLLDVLEKDTPQYKSLENKIKSYENKEINFNVEDILE